MLASKGKISVRQLIILLIMTTMSPAVRIFPQYAAKIGGKAGWLAPLVASIPVIFLILVLNSLFKSKKEKNLCHIFCEVLGNIVGRIVASLYLVWVLVLLALYIRYYAERILSTTMPKTSIAFLIVAMLCIVLFAAKKGLVTVARANEIFFYVFILVFLLTFVFSISQIHYRSLMNVSYLDAWPAAKASTGVFAVWGYIIYMFFFAQQINDNEKIKTLGFRGVGILVISSIAGLIMTIGTFGAEFIAHISFPFFATVKNISILEAVDHLEPAVVALWVISDFVIITVFTIVAANITKSVFKLSNAKSIVSPIVIFSGISALYFFKNRFELEAFTNNIALYVNILLEFIIPFIVFGIGKIRKKI